MILAFFCDFFVIIHGFGKRCPQGRGESGKASRNKKTKIFPDRLAGIHGRKSQHLPSYGPTAHWLLKLLVFISESSKQQTPVSQHSNAVFNSHARDVRSRAVHIRILKWSWLARRAQRGLWSHLFKARSSPVRDYSFPARLERVAP